MESNLLQRLHETTTEFLEKDCSSAEIATCLGALSYCRLKRAPLSFSPY